MGKEFFDKKAEELERVSARHHCYDFYLKLNKEAPQIVEYLKKYVSTETREVVTFEKDDKNLHEMINLALEFFDELDENLAEKILSIFEDLTTEYRPGRPSENGGINSVGVRHKISRRGNEKINVRIELNPRNNKHGLIVVAHELCHMAEERVQKKVPQKTDCLVEIAPMFIEKIYADWLLKNGEISESDRAQCEILEKDNLLKHAEVILQEIEIFDNLGKPPITGGKLARMEEKYRGTEKYEILSNRIGEMLADKTYGEREFRYVVGAFVSKALYEDFKKNQKETIEKFEAFIDKNSEISASEGFETLLGKDYATKIVAAVSEKERSK